MRRARHDCDVLIVGGGLVGSALANALSALPIETTLVETFDPRALEQPSFDARATALANGSQRILDAMGLWNTIRHEAEPIVDIYVSERGRFGRARISAQEEGVPALGFTVENRVLGEALWSYLSAAPRFHCLAPATLESFATDNGRVTASINAQGQRMTVTARLLVAADGARSMVRDALEVAAADDDYDQAAVVFNCRTEVPLAGSAFERFCANGPLAILPLTRGRAAVIWTLAPEKADLAMTWADRELADEFVAAFSRRLGSIVRVGARSLYPLRRVRSRELVRDRVVFLGNAANSVHPVAGQGFNLALRDVATLADLIADEIARSGRSADIGSRALLAAYADWRSRDQKRVSQFTHGLVRLFGMSLPGLGVLRGAGLVMFDLLPGAKALLARHTMGRAGRLPRLARGLGLDA